MNGDSGVKELGHISEIVRYPVKSMAGTLTESASLGWHGLDGDRRFAIRRLGDNNGFPWVSASRLPELLLYRPMGIDEKTGEPLPTHVRTPAGRELELQGAELQSEIGERLGKSVELMRLKHGIFDEAPVSVISLSTILGIGRQLGSELDRRRFRANIVLETDEVEPFAEDEWIGGELVFGEARSGPSVGVTLRDLRCAMLNLDPDSAARDEQVMKTVVRLNKNFAGVYGTVLRTGVVRVGDPVTLVK